MDTLRSLSAFGLMVFTVWALSTTHALGGQPTCPCLGELGVPLELAMMRAGFPTADARTEAICDTHPIALPPSPNLPPSPVLEARVVPPSPIQPEELPPSPILVADIAIRDGVGTCEFILPPSPTREENLDRSTG